MDTVNEVIARILAQRRDLTPDQLQKLVEEKRREAGDLLSEEGAARLVAEELLVETEPAAAPIIEIRKLVAGLNDVTLTGKVLASEPVKDFVRQDGSTGRALKVVLGDETGKIPCIVWNSKADELLSRGDLAGATIAVRHGYTRSGLTGEVELNVGERSEIMVTSEPEVVITPIGGIAEPTIELNLLGIIHSRPRLYEFDRNGQKGTVLRTLLTDKTGSIPIVAWNEKAEELRNLKRGDIVRIVNGRLRRDSSGRLEIHLENRARVGLIEEAPEGFDVPEIRLHKVAELRPGLPAVNLVARVVGLTGAQQVERKSGEKVAVSRILVGDDTGMVSVSLWDDKADLVSQLKIGDVVRIEDAVANLRLGQISVSAGKTAFVQRMPDAAETINVKVTKISETGSDSQLVAIEGEIAAQPETREVTTGRGEKVQVTSARIRDDTGEARISFWRSQAAEAGKLRAGTRIRVYGLLSRPGLAEKTEFSTVQASNVEVLDRVAGQRPSSSEIRQFIALKENEQAWVRAIILDAGEDASLTSVCSQCEEPVAPSDDHFLCKTHGAQAEPTWVLATQMRLDDGTDTIVAKVRTRQPQTLIGKSISWAQKEILAKRTSTVALPIDATGKLAGMRIEAFGVARRDSQTAKLVFHTDKLFLEE